MQTSSPLTLACLTVLALTGCQMEPPPTPATVPSAPPMAQAAPPAVIETPVPVPLPGQLKPLPSGAERRSSRAGKKPRDPQTSIAQAQAEARQEPTPEGYLNSMQVYTYVPGALYQLYTAPENVTDIALQPGETLIAKAAGDTVRWVVGDTTSGTGSQQQVHVFVKPTKDGLHTNLVLTTDRRTYHLECHSTTGTYMAAVSWRYPQDEMRQLAQPATGSKTLATRGASVPGFDATALHFAYRLDSKDKPRWMPVQVFDDGQKTYIQFPAGLTTTEAPALFLRSAEGTPQLVNYRVRDRWYIVDRLFEEAELRVGEKHPSVVRIQRQP
jgi:P-type conjugative transfer protein TrbG